MKCPHCGKELDLEALRRELMAEQGRAKSEAKQAASRENGKKGGRPRKAK